MLLPFPPILISNLLNFCQSEDEKWYLNYSLFCSPPIYSAFCSDLLEKQILPRHLSAQNTSFISHHS